MQLRNTVVIVTGAARGIGRAIAEALIGRGARVCLADILADEVRRTAAELDPAGARSLAVAADTTDPAQVESLAARAESALGPVDALVNNAGTFSSVAPVWQADPERWFRDIRVNLYGSFLCCRAVLARMVPRRRGAIVNIASSGGVSDPHPYCTSYACSKTGLVRLTEGIAAEGAEHGILAFAVAPPAVLTDMTRFIMEDEGGRRWKPGFEKLFSEGHDLPAPSVGRFVADVLERAGPELSGRLLSCTADIDALAADGARIRRGDLLTLRMREA
jgi:NAD(P)-dependent dehydrogenase (short-subunit alcohol dehydrogenase family)